ncbi:MAG: M1 family aminopeptidase, partial [Candidatus Sumerlaeia bacterium]|nr:M1 family aminopeptidase [Candidatus Sumerlaeia bacterium]
MVSNGKLLSIEDVAGNKRCFHYAETYPMVTYLASICCTNYVFGSTVYTALDGITTMTVGHYVYPENSDELGGIVGTMEAMLLFRDLFGEYPFLREKYVTATHNSGSGMEHQTCTSMPPRDLVPDGRGRRNIHELAHQWFGDSITMRHFDHLWLNEGFATYCEALYVEHFQGRSAYHNYVNRWNTLGINDTTPLVNPNADAFSGSLVYRKGAWVLHMLRHVVGDEKFFTALRNYYQRFAYQTTLTPDLQAEFEAVYGASLEWFFQEWVYGTGRPTYNWSWVVEKTKGDNILHLTITQTQSGNVFTMPLDVKVSDVNGNSETYVVWNNQRTQVFDINIGNLDAYDVVIDPDKWVLHRVGTSAPVPTLKSVIGSSGNYSATVNWQSGGGNTAGFQLIASVDLTNWTLIADRNVLSPTVQSFVLTNLIPDTPYYIRIRAIASTGQPSALSDVYGVKLTSIAGAPKVLVVDGYDRWDSQGRGTSHPWAAWHGKAVNAYGYVAFDSCANEAVIDGSVPLNNYSAVLWVLGEESTTDETFSTQEQNLVKGYLNNGGSLLVSGSEIGWDLDNRGTSEDIAFYNNYLKADYVSDNSADYSVYGTGEGIFAGLSVNFDDGSAGIYPVGYPDVITPYGGSIATLRYNENAIAAVQF